MIWAEITVPYTKTYSPTEQNPTSFIFYKNTKELEHYFQCFKLHRNSLSDKQKKIISITSKHYNLPYPLIACTLFIESRFNIHAISHAGAHGLAQFMPETLSTIVALNTPPTKAQLRGCQSEKLSDSEMNYCQALYEQQRYVALWTSLQGKLNRTKLSKGKFQFDPFSPTESIAMSGMYLHYLLNRIDQKTNAPRGKMFNERVMSEYKLALAAYNRGPGKIGQLIQKQKEQTGAVNLEEIVSMIRINKETAEHMDAIEKCLTKNDYRQPINMIPEKTITCHSPQ